VRSLFLALALVALGVAFFVLRPPPSPGLALRDFEAYYAAGGTWRYHGDAYSREVWRVEKDVPGVIATRDEVLPFVGPPFGLPLWSAFARLPWPAASFAWAVVVALAFATIALGSLALAGGPIVPRDAVAVLALAGGFGPLTSGVALGQAAVVATAAIVAVPFLARPRCTYALLAAALVAALQPNLALVLAARMRDGRTRIAFIGAAIFAAGASVLALGGPLGALGYAAALRTHAAAERFIAIQTTPAAVARAFGADAAVAEAFGAALALAVVALLGLQVLSRHYAPDDGLALACAAAPLALPFAHEHDFAIAFLPAIVLARRARDGAWYAAAAGTLALAIDWLGLAQRPAGAFESVGFALAVGFAMLALGRAPFAPARLVPLGIATAAIIAGAAFAHPLPTWPDRLPLDFHVPATLPVGETWRAEQVATGIAALDPTWALLRALSLVGCATLWATGSLVLRRPPSEAGG
jgi:hypothetical protein